MGSNRNRMAESESIAPDCARLTLCVQPKVGTTPLEVAQKFAELLSSDTSSDDRFLTKILGEPAGDTIVLAIPAELLQPALGVTQLLNILSIPAEYDCCDRLLFQRIEIPREALGQYGGPYLGVEDTRSIFGVKHQGPLLGAILKPRLIDDLDATMKTIAAFAQAELDFLVDDELVIDNAAAPFKERIGRAVATLDHHRVANGRTTAFVANVTARPSHADRFAEIALQEGARGLVTNPIVVGFGGLEELAKAGRNMPIFATNMGTALLAKDPRQGHFAGLTESLVSKLTRLAGADAVHGGIGESDWYGGAPADGARDVLYSKLGPVKPAFRVVAGGLDIVKMIDNWPLDQEPVIFEGGSAIFRHPDGVKAGARAFRKSWEIAMLHMTADKESRQTTKVALLKASQSDKDIERALEEAHFEPSDELMARARRSTRQTTDSGISRIWNKVKL